jgi:hypothetical protein
MPVRLDPNEEKYTFSAIFQLNNKAEILDSMVWYEPLYIQIKDFLMKKHKL